MTDKSKDPTADFVTENFVDGEVVKAEEKKDGGVEGTREDGGHSDVRGRSADVEGDGVVSDAGDDTSEPDKEADTEDDEEAKSEDETKASGDDEPAKEADKTPKRKFGDRYREFKDKERAWEREKAELSQRLAALESGELTTPAKAAKDDTSKKPDPKEYEYGELDSEYIAAVVSHETHKVIAAERQRDEERKSAEATAARHEQYKDKAAVFKKAGEKEIKDFDKVVLRNHIITEDLTPTLHDLILDSKVGHKIAHHLGAHPEEALEVYGKSPVEQAAWFGRQLARFEAPPKASNTKTPAAVSAPPKPGGGGGKMTTPLDTTDFSAFEQQWKAEQRKRRG